MSRNFQALSLRIPAVVASHGFRIAHRKTAYKRGRLRTLGVVVGQNTLRAPAEILARASDPSLSSGMRSGLTAYADAVRRASRSR